MADSDPSFHSIGSLHQKGRNTSSGIRSQLWQGLDEDTTKAVVQYLLQREVGDEDPILVMDYTDEFETLRGNNPNNKAEVVNALMTFAVDNSGGLGTCFIFASHDDLQRARQSLRDATHPGNVAWAFYYGPAIVATLQADMGASVPPERQVPTIRTRMITFYSHATGRLTHDEFDVFMH